MAILPTKYAQYNDFQSKRPVLVAEIEGLDTISSAPPYTKVRYGDPFVNFGDPGLVYGGLRLLTEAEGYQTILSLDGSTLTLSQKVEPEQGRASISTLTLAFIDKNLYMTRACSPGVIVPEIIGRSVTVRLGFQEISYPEDYFVVFRGKVSSVRAAAGIVTLQLSDANIKKKQSVFFTAKTTLTTSLTSGDTTIPVVANGDFHKQILGPDAAYDSGVRTFLQIADEVIEYDTAGFGSNTFTGVTRGALSTTAVSHDAGDDVSALVSIEGHAIDMALKVMLSGWNGPYLQNIQVAQLAQTFDPVIGIVPSCIMLPQAIDGVDRYGIAVGDYITVTGSTIPANNKTVQVLGFNSAFEFPNNMILCDEDFTIDVSSGIEISVRSQFDTYPTTCGLKLAGTDVNVSDFINLKNTFLGSGSNAYRFYKSSKESSGKQWIDSQIVYPMGCYSVTRLGRLSIVYTHPPIADQRTVIIDNTSIINPENIAPERSTNNRKFFNEIDYEYDWNREAGKYLSSYRTFDSDSISLIDLVSILPIKSEGLQTDLGAASVIPSRAAAFLNRYKDCAVEYKMKVNWRIGAQVEVGDVVVLVDEGTLQISNFNTGERDVGTQLYEVTERSLNFKEGNANLTLLGGIGTALNDRYATWSFSSQCDVGSTNTKIRFKDSFGALYPQNEWRKWSDFANKGYRVRIHSPDYTNDDTVEFLQIDPTDQYAMLLGASLSFVPSPDDVIEIADYEETSDQNEKLYKLMHIHWTPTVPVVSGVDSLSFNVSLLNAAKFTVGLPVLIHNDDYSILSVESNVVSIVGTLITVETALGFTPSAGQNVELIGFIDGGQPYRWI